MTREENFTVDRHSNYEFSLAFGNDGPDVTASFDKLSISMPATRMEDDSKCLFVRVSLSRRKVFLGSDRKVFLGS